jgi:hypothetical protein
MSRKDIEIIRRGNTALNRGDVEAWLDAFHVDAEMYDLASGPEAPARQGHDALRDWARTMDELWKDGRHDPERFIDAGDFVVVAVRARGRRRGIDAPVDIPLFHVFEMRDGKIQRGRAYLDETEALEAVGLSELPMPRENAQLAYQVFQAFNRRDLGAYLALMDIDVEAGSLLAALEGGYRGHAGVRRWWRTLLDVVPDYTTEVVEVRDVGDLTLVTLRERGHGADSDTPFDTPGWWIGRWRCGRCVWWRSAGSEAEVLEAAGVRK